MHDETTKTTTEEKAAEDRTDLAGAVTVEEISPVSKRLKVSIPEDKLKEKYKGVLKELSRDAAVPGFRKGRVPPRILEKRFGTNIKDTVKGELIQDVLKYALEEYKINPLGDPQFDPAKPELPDAGPMQFTVEVEVAPEFPLPELTNIEIKKPHLEATEERFNLAISHLRQSLGTWETIPEASQPDDRIHASIEYSQDDGIVLGKEEHRHLHLKPGALGGIQFDDLAERLKGAKPGAVIQLSGEVPMDSAQENLRGRKINIAISVKHIDRQFLPELTDELARENGFDGMEDLNKSMREALEDRLKIQTNQIMRDQVAEKLLGNVTIDLPPRLTERQTKVVMRRRAMRLMQQGVPAQAIDRHITDLITVSAQEANVLLKAHFVFSRLADQFDISVSDEEVNQEIVQIADMNGRRPERLRDEMIKSGQVEELYQTIRDNKVLDQIITGCKITEVDEETWKQEVEARRQQAQSGASGQTGKPAVS
jgi:trigger factor